MIEFDVIITNGYVDRDTIFNKVNNGWTFVATVPAKNIHPHAMETDKATIFSRYLEMRPKESETPTVAKKGEVVWKE